ncbi:MAG TPA: hypothetical protein VFX09_00480 [Burkholderiales bacterium]|nr:hypothetical protein [Burkholderiales bacterium]
MHCELVVPGLLRANSAERLPALELLLARGRSCALDAGSLELWLEENFLEDCPSGQQLLPAGALTLLAHGDDARAQTWVRADPVHLQAMRDRLVMVPGEALSISRKDADALCAALNTQLEGRVELRAVEPERWCARLSGQLPWPGEPALQIAGRSLEAQPGAAQAGDALLTELQMLLHEHPVNEAREARGELPVNSLWLWGAGGLPTGASSRWQSVAAAEPLALGLARLAGTRALGLPASAALWLSGAPQDGRHLFILDALRAPLALSDEESLQNRLPLLERNWFSPLLDALREGLVGMVTIHVPDRASGVSFETIRGDLRRFWRRARPASSWAQQE